MNKIFVRNSCKTYQQIAASSGAANTATQQQKKNPGKQEDGENFREILAKKLKAA